MILVGVGASFTLFAANANALVQLAAPDHLRGRLVALYLFMLRLGRAGGSITLERMMKHCNF